MDDRERITSRDNRRLVALRKVRDGKERSLIFIEGVRLCVEALRSGIEGDECYVSDSFDAWDRFPNIRERSVGVAAKLFPSVSDTDNSQGIILTAKRPAYDLHDIKERMDRAGSIPITIFLSEVNNPANLGAVLRSAEAAGAAGIITSPASADPYSPKALRASMGSAFRLPVVENIDLQQALSWAAELQLATIAIDVNGRASYTDLNWTEPALVVFGSEAHGLRPGQLDQVAQKVVIPMDGKVESLNLAVSAAVILFEARRKKLEASGSRWHLKE